MFLWRYGSIHLQTRVRMKAPTEEQIAKILGNPNFARRFAVTALFFSDSLHAVTPEFGIWKMLANFHVLPARTVLLTIQIVHIPFVLPTSCNGHTALQIKVLGHGIYNIVATFGYAQSWIYANMIATDIINELNRLEHYDNNDNDHKDTNQQEFSDFEHSGQKENNDKVLYLVCYQQLAAAKRSSWARRIRLGLFNWLSQNSSKLSHFYHIPFEQLIEMGNNIVI